MRGIFDGAAIAIFVGLLFVTCIASINFLLKVLIIVAIVSFIKRFID